MKKDESVDGYERRRRAIRDQILDATISLIKAHGNTDMTVRDIANSAGVSPATPFNHFRSKDGIFGAIVSRSMRDLYSLKQDKTGGTVPGLFSDITKYYVSNEKVFKPVFGVVLQKIPPTSRTLKLAIRAIKRRIELQIEQGQLMPHAVPAILAEQLETFWFGTIILWSGGTISSEEWLIRTELGVELILNGFYPDVSREKSVRKLARLQKKMSPVSDA